MLKQVTQVVHDFLPLLLGSSINPEIASLRWIWHSLSNFLLSFFANLAPIYTGTLFSPDLGEERIRFHAQYHHQPSEVKIV